MGDFLYKKCSYCKSINHTEAYKLNPKNFSTFSIDITTPGSANMHQHKQVTVCNECMDSANNPIQPMLDVITTGVTNDAEMAAANAQ